MKVETFNEFFFASIFYSIDYIKQQQQQKTAQHSPLAECYLEKYCCFENFLVSILGTIRSPPEFRVLHNLLRNFYSKLFSELSHSQLDCGARQVLYYLGLI